MSYVEEIDQLTAEVAKAERERDEARAIVAQVRALHRADDDPCTSPNARRVVWCNECGHAYPCVTTRALGSCPDFEGLGA